MAGPAGEIREREWVVDLASRRIVCRTHEPPAVDCEDAMSDDKEREDALRDLNPIEDVKGAIKFIKDLHPIEELKEFMETAVKVLEPSESDLRVIEPEEDTVSEMEVDEGYGGAETPEGAHPQPDAKALNKEHRGY